MGASVVAKLIELLQDEEASFEDSPGNGWPPIHAVDLLVDLKAEEAIEPLLEVLEASSIDDIIYSRIAIRLPKLGAPVLEPALRLMDEVIDGDVFDALCSVISELGIRDERIFELLCDHFETDEALGAICFAEYGDERALPLLKEAIEEFEPNWESEFGMMDLNEFEEAYKRIAGALPTELTEHISELRAEWDSHVAKQTVLAAPVVSDRIGRNEPCPCGSGKKYKKCCQGSVLQ